MHAERDLTGRVAVVTGVGRRAGIGYAIARRPADRGAALYLTHWRPHDEEQPWGADDIDAIRRGLSAAPRVVDHSVDTGFLAPDTTDLPAEFVEQVHSAFPRGRAGRPDDPARLIEWLVSDAGRWVVGQVLDSEGGFRRSRF